MITPPHPLFGKYEILAELGRGGFGQVLKARHQVLDELRALKRFNTDLSKEEELRRFQREAKLLMRLSRPNPHPHIVQIHDAAVEQGYAYIDMEYIEGQDVGKVLKAGPLPVPEVERLLHEMAGALAFIHSREVIHRDLKPGNIMRRAADGAYVLTDFGLAFVGNDGRSLLGMGTPEYMSPEQIDGTETFAADVYSLGVVLFECLTGQVPFPQEGKHWSAMERLGRRIRQEVPPRVDVLRPETPAWLADVVARCLEKDPTLRPTAAAIDQRDAAAASGTGRNQPARTEEEGVYTPPAPAFPNWWGEDVLPGNTDPAPVFRNRIGMEFVLIPAGEFWMGQGRKADEKPSLLQRMIGSKPDFSDEELVHRVRITQPFYLGKYPVTQGQWQAVMGKNPSHFKGEKRPVERVSWEEAQAFIGRLNAREGGEAYRLPTEAEWEYACRAGTTGERYGDLDQIAWYGENAGGETHEVGLKAANAWGLHDMLGNVWEWVSDWYARDYYGRSPVDDPQGPNNGNSRVYRGGSWNYYPLLVRTALRHYGGPTHRGINLGFRVARTVTL